jgi:hypothetical protein
MFATMSMYVLEMRHSDWSKIEFVFDCYWAVCRFVGQFFRSITARLADTSDDDVRTRTPAIHPMKLRHHRLLRLEKFGGKAFILANLCSCFTMTCKQYPSLGLGCVVDWVWWMSYRPYTWETRKALDTDCKSNTLRSEQNNEPGTCYCCQISLKFMSVSFLSLA